MSVEIQTILNYIEEYASNDHPPKEEGYIIPLQLGYVDSILLMDYITTLQRKEYNNSKAVEYINNKWEKDKYYEDIENCMTFCKYDKDDLLNILEKGE